MSFLFSQIGRLLIRNPVDILHFMAYYLRTAPARFRDRFPGSSRIQLVAPADFSASVAVRKFPKILEELIMECSQEGNRLLEHLDLTLLGQELSVGWPPNWETPETGTFPKGISSTIPYYGKSITNDIKLVWEIGRLQWLPPIAALSNQSEDAELMGQVCTALIDYAEHHPYGRTVAWMEGIEVSLRAISIISTIGIVADSINIEHRRKLAYWLGLHGEWLHSHLSRKWRMNNNHLLLELIGLAIIGSQLPDHSESENWRKRAISGLIRELELQTKDGRNWEPTTAYHRFVSEALLVLFAFIDDDELFDDADISRIREVVDSHVRTLVTICDENGMMPLIGDDDAAIVLPRPLKTSCRDSNHTIRLAEKLGFDTSRSGAGVRIWDGHCTGVVWDSNWHVHAISGSSRGASRDASHRHLDMLSVTVNLRGNDVLKDCGTGIYFGSDPWRNFFRGPKCHSGIFSSSQEWAKVRGPFEITRTPLGSIEAHDGVGISMKCWMGKRDFAIRNIKLEGLVAILEDTLELDNPVVNLVLPSGSSIECVDDGVLISGENFTMEHSPAPLSINECNAFSSPETSTSPSELTSVASSGYGEFEQCSTLSIFHRRGTSAITKISLDSGILS